MSIAYKSGNSPAAYVRVVSVATSQQSNRATSVTAHVL